MPYGVSVRRFKKKKKVNVSFCENAKELSGPSSRAASRNVHGVVSAFVPDRLFSVSSLMQQPAATTEEEFHCKMPRLDFNIVIKKKKNQTSL